MWVEIKLNRESYLTGLFYSPWTADASFFDALSKNIEKALDITNDIIILGDMNEDLLNPKIPHLKDVLLLNSLHNIISEPTCQLSLIDPIILHDDMSPLNQGIIKVPPNIIVLTYRLAITLMYCNRLHAWCSTQSRLATLLSSLIARRWVGLQTLWWFRLKDLSIDEMVGAWCFGCLSGPPGFTFWISFAPVFSLIYCWVLILALSPCYILIYMF